MGIRTLISYIVLIVLISISTVFGITQCVQNKKLKQDIIMTEKSFKEMERIKDNLVKSSRQMVSKKTLDEYLQKNKELREYISKFKPEIKYVTKIKTITKYLKISDKSSDKVIKKKEITEYIKELQSSAGLSLAQVTFKNPHPKPWSYIIYPRKTHITVMNNKEKDGDRIVVHAYEEDKNGKKSPLSLVDVQTIIKRPSIKSFSFELNEFQLELYGLLAFGINTTPNVGIGIGAHLFRLKLKEKESMRFVGIVAGYQAGAVALTFHPFSFNLGTVIPVLKDTHLTFGIGGGYFINEKIFGPVFNIGIGSTL